MCTTTGTAIFSNTLSGGGNFAGSPWAAKDFTLLYRPDVPRVDVTFRDFANCTLAILEFSPAQWAAFCGVLNMSWADGPAAAAYLQIGMDIATFGGSTAAAAVFATALAAGNLIEVNLTSAGSTVESVMPDGSVVLPSTVVDWNNAKMAGIAIFSTFMTGVADYKTGTRKTPSVVTSFDSRWCPDANQAHVVFRDRGHRVMMTLQFSASQWAAFCRMAGAVSVTGYAQVNMDVASFGGTVAAAVPYAKSIAAQNDVIVNITQSGSKVEHVMPDGTVVVP